MDWNEWLEFYYEKYKYPFVVQKFLDFPFPWLNYGTQEYHDFIAKEKFVTNREVFFDEIVFDIDMDKDISFEQAKKDGREIAELMSDRLKKFGYSHKVWDSGGRGFHISSFYPELMKLNSLDNRLMKRAFIGTVCQGFVKPRKTITGRVQTQALTTIQLENSPHRKGGTKKLLWEFDNGTNVLHELFYKGMQEEKNRNNVRIRHFKKQLEEKTPDAIVFLENEQFHKIKDGRERALFILTVFYKNFMSDDEVYKKLSNWNKMILKGYFTKTDISRKVKHLKAGYPVNMIIELFQELGLPEKYITNK